MECGSAYYINVSDSSVTGELTNYISHYCEKCGMAMEEDDFGQLPEKLRNIVLKQDGKWGLNLISGKKSVIGKVIKEMKSMNIDEIFKLLKKVPGILFVGTRAEMEVIKHHFDKEEIESVVEPIE